MRGFYLISLGFLMFFMVGNMPAIAQTKLFLTPNKSENAREEKGKSPRLFLPQGKSDNRRSRGRASEKETFFSKLFSRNKSRTADSGLKELRLARGQSLDAKAFIAAYNDALDIDPSLLKRSGRAPRNADEIRQRNVIKQTPLMLDIIERREIAHMQMAALRQRQETRQRRARTTSRETAERNAQIQRRQPQKRKPVFINPNASGAKKPTGVFTNFR